MLTVLVTTYNHEAFIEQALESVLAQEAGFAWDVVVIDDASTDGTRDLVRGLRDLHPDRVRLAFNEVNENSNRRFREELERCPSAYVATLDGDDYWTSPSKLARQVAVLERRRECSICFHDVELVSDDPSLPAWHKNGPQWDRALTVEDLWATNFIAGCSPVLRRACIPRLPAWYDSAPWGDWPLYLLCAQRGPIAYLDEVMGAYRLHAGGLWSRLGEEQRLAQVVAFLEEMQERMPRHAGVIACQLSRARRALALERRQAPLRTPELRRWRIQGPPASEQRARLDALVAGHVPAGAGVIRVQHEPHRGPAAPAPLRLPPPPPRVAQRRFAAGPSGAVVAPWLLADRVYELALRRPGGHGDALAVAIAVGEPAGAGAGAPAPAAVDHDPAVPFVRVEPALVPCRQGAGAATVTWSTGDGSPGEVWIASYPVTAGLPATEEEAVAALVSVRAAGGDFLLVPESGAWWLAAHPLLASHVERWHRRVAHVRGLASLYDLNRLPSRPRRALARVRYAVARGRR